MSDNRPATVHEEAHTGPIKNPKQLLLAVFFSFVIPIFIIIGLVYFVVSAYKPAGTADTAAMELSGMTEQAREQALAQRIQKVGTSKVTDANREMQTGEQVYTTLCMQCHANGPGPKFGDAAVWGPRIKLGYDVLLNSALKGKGSAMPAMGGGEFTDYEIARAVVYMTNASGAKFAEPEKPAPATPAQ